MSKYLKNNQTGEEVHANGVDFTSNNIRLDSGDLKAYPSAWDENKTQIDEINDNAIVYLSTTDEYKDFTIITE